MEKHDLRYAENHKDKTHKKLLSVAAEQFCQNGIDGVGIATIMKEAGLTNGAFYAHFSSKEEMISEVLTEILDKKDKAIREQGVTPSDLVEQYLSPSHRDERAQGCPIAALLSELIRYSDSTRAVLTDKTERLMRCFSIESSKYNTEIERSSIVVFSLLVGALQLSRVVTDEKLSNEILSSAKKAAIDLLSV